MRVGDGMIPEANVDMDEVSVCPVCKVVGGGNMTGRLIVERGFVVKM